jgi:hypothetical protein
LQSGLCQQTPRKVIALRFHESNAVAAVLVFDCEACGAQTYK